MFGNKDEFASRPARHRSGPARGNRARGQDAQDPNIASDAGSQRPYQRVAAGASRLLCFAAYGLVCLILAAVVFSPPARGGDPWFEPAAKKTMTKAQKKWLTKREKQWDSIKGLYSTDIRQAYRLSYQSLQQDLRVFGEDHEETARGLYFLYNVAWRARNQDAIFLKASLESLGDMRGIYGRKYGRGSWQCASANLQNAVSTAMAKAGPGVQETWGTGFAELDKAWAFIQKEQPAKGAAAAKKAVGYFTQARKAAGLPLANCGECASALKAMARAYVDLGQFDSAEATIREALQITDAAYTWGDEEGRLLIRGTDHPSYADCLKQLAAIHGRKGEYAQAELVLRQALQILEKAHGGPHRDIADLYATLGRHYEDQRQYPRAVEIYRQGMKTWKASNGRYPVTYSTFLTGEAYCLRFMGKGDEAEPLLEENVKYCKEKFGDQSYSYSVALSSLAHLQIDQKKYQEALKSYRAAAAILAKEYGKSHVEYSVVAIGVGRTQGRLKQYTRAEATLREALDVLRKKLGMDHLHTRNAHDALCDVFSDLVTDGVEKGEFDEARAAAEKLVAARVDFYGGEHWSVQSARAELSTLETLEKKTPEERERVQEAGRLITEAADLSRDGKDAEAVALLEKALAARKELLGEEAARTADAMVRLANTYHRLGRTADAEKFYRTAAMVYEKIWPAKYLPPAHAEACAQVAAYCKQRGDLGQAAQLYNLARLAYKRVYGEASNLYAGVLLESGRVRVSMGDLVQAEVLFRELLEQRINYAGKESAAYAEALEELATVLRLASKPEQAEPLLLEALERTKPEPGKFRVDNIRIRNQLGLYYRANRKLAQAQAHFQQCVDEYKGISTGDENFATYSHNLGSVLHDRGQADQAEPHLRQTLEILTRLNKPRERTYSRLTRLLEERARRLTFEGKDEPALRAQAEVAAVLEKQAGPKHWRTQAARAHLAALEAIAPLPPDKRSKVTQGMSTAAEANRLLVNGKFSEGVATAQRALELRKEALGGKHLDVAADEYRLGLLLERVGRNPEAAGAFDRALEVRTASLGADHPETASVLDAAGQLAFHSGDYPLAERLFGRAAAALARSTGGWAVPTLASQCRQGRAVLRQGHFLKAEGLVRSAYDRMQFFQGDSMEEYCEAAQTMAEWFVAVGDLERADTLLQQTEALAKRYLADPTRTLAGNLQVQARLREARKQPAEAEGLARRAADLTHQVWGEPSTAHAAALTTLARIQGSLNKNALAEAVLLQAAVIYDKALGKDRAAAADFLQAQGVVQANKGEFAKAEGMLTAALEARKKQGGESSDAYAENLRDLGRLMQQTGATDRAAAYFRQFLGLYRERLKHAAGIQTERQHVALTRQLREALDCLLSLPTKPGEVEALYAEVIGWKGAAFARNEQLRRARGNPALKALFDKWEETAHQLATIATRIPYAEERVIWYHRVEQLTRDREQLERRLFHEAARTAPIRPTTPDDLRKDLPVGAVLLDFLEYVRREPQSRSPGSWDVERCLTCFVVVRGHAVRRIDLGPVRVLDGLIQQWRKDSEEAEQLEINLEVGRKLTDKDKARLNELRRTIPTLDDQISQFVLERLADAIRDADTILAAPDGQLTMYPLAALQTSKGHFLIEDKGVVIVPVPAVLPQFLADRPTDVAPMSLLAMGNVDYASPPERTSRSANGGVGGSYLGTPVFDYLTPLPLSGEFVKRVAKIVQDAYPGAPSEVFLARTASQSAFRKSMPASRWLVLSTHGFFNGEGEYVRAAMARIGRLPPTTKRTWGTGQAGGGMPSILSDAGMMSGITLAGATVPDATGDDGGVLWTLELASMNMSHVDVAILSACQTAEGELASGEGVFGVQRAFHAAGVRSVVSTLWSMRGACNWCLERFTANVLRKKMTKLEALREAQMWMFTAARRNARGERFSEPLTFESEVVPAWWGMTHVWSVLELSGDWR